FGDLADAIDGRPDGLPGGADDPAFHGFLRVEHLAWAGAPAADVAAAVTDLDASVHALQTSFAGATIVASDVPLRAHEILENTLQFELTGDTDQGSHTSLATARANVDGTTMVVDALAVALRTRDPRRLDTVEAALRALAQQLDDLRDPAGSWPPVSAL